MLPAKLCAWAYRRNDFGRTPVKIQSGIPVHVARFQQTYIATAHVCFHHEAWKRTRCTKCEHVFCMHACASCGGGRRTSALLSRVRQTLVSR